jgi:hypothetical protein
MCTMQTSDAPILMLTTFFAEPHYHVRMRSITSPRGAAYRGWQERLVREIIVVGLQVPRRTYPLF